MVFITQKEWYTNKASFFSHEKLLRGLILHLASSGPWKGINVLTSSYSSSGSFPFIICSSFDILKAAHSPSDLHNFTLTFSRLRVSRIVKRRGGTWSFESLSTPCLNFGVSPRWNACFSFARLLTCFDSARWGVLQIINKFKLGPHFAWHRLRSMRPYGFINPIVPCST